ncbi:unnamed protein product [Effrenium voratum]|uniref:Uncharacterized protein n=1 Tax=Effrenium voratum TaxID=2562239 RepID=A0AA36HLM5_9DINO|nr:unnamed protein product [Effrenium voratum]
MFFRLTGWATNLDKAVEFGLDAKVLGLQVDLSGLSSGLAKLGNTESRRHELDETISEVLKKKNLGVHEGQRLRGRLLFAESQVFGRRATVAMGILNHHIHVVQGGRISGDLVWALEMLRDKVVHGRPREITHHMSKAVHLYVDACHEESREMPAGLGGILVFPESNKRRFFSKMMDHRCGALESD